MTLGQVATDLSCRLMRLFCRDAGGRQPVFGGSGLFNNAPHWRDCIPFYEYLHGDTGAGHQTGWTALVAKLIQQSGGQA